MAERAAAAAPSFSQPVRQIVLMLLVLGLTALGVWMVAPAVAPVFLANPWLNGFIALVFVVGVLATFWQLWQLVASVRWIAAFTGDEGGTALAPPRLLAPLAALLRSRGARLQVGSAAARSILDSVATRIDEARDITRYITSLLIFLGLLGTFWGLATTVPALVETIRSLVPEEGEEAMAVFDRLMSGLDAQLSGMGVAFASSLIGLAGSLVVGLLELFAGHGQNRFYRELEEWLSTITRVGLGGEGEEGNASLLPAVVDHMAEQMEAMQDMFARGDEARAATDARLHALIGAVGALTGKLSDAGATDAMLERAAEAQERIAQGQERIAQLLAEGGSGGGLDAESRMRLRSIDVQMLRLLEEVSAGRHEAVAELRADLEGIAEALRPAGQGPQPLAPRRRGQAL